jgi:hypothetical protein
MTHDRVERGLLELERGAVADYEADPGILGQPTCPVVEAVCHQPA